MFLRRMAPRRYVEPGRKALRVVVALAVLAALGSPCPPAAGERAADHAPAAVADAAAAHAAHAARASLSDAWCGRPLAVLAAPCPCGCEDGPASLASPLGSTLLLASASPGVPLGAARAPAAPPLRLPEPAPDPIEHVPLAA